jgi:hypothetical protein
MINRRTPSLWHAGAISTRWARVAVGSLEAQLASLCCMQWQRAAAVPLAQPLGARRPGPRPATRFSVA